jgi:HEAT repeat protein
MCPRWFGNSDRVLRMSAKWLETALLLLAIAVPVCAGQEREQHRQPPPNVSELIQEVKSLPDSQERSDAARELTMVEPLPPEAIQALAEALKTTEQNGAVERYAKQALIKAGARAIPALTPLVENNKRQVNEAAVETLGRIAISEPAAWPILIGTFKENPSRWGAAYELAKVGPLVVPVLRKALTDKDPRMRAGAAQALAQMGDFYRTWSDSNPDARRQAGVVLASTADMAPAAPELAEVLKDSDPKIRYPAAIALAYADPTDRRAVPVLIDILGDKDMFARQAAVAALEEMGSNAERRSRTWSMR